MTWRELATSKGPFRRLWFGEAVSLFGDWFTYVAVGVLALGPGDGSSGLLPVAIVLLAHSLPLAVIGPLAGRLADRYDRRRIMVVASLLRALTVVGMITAASVGAFGWVSGLLFVRMGFGAFVEPAASASLPQLVARASMTEANALLSATWSVMFAIGVALGGMFTAAFGPVWALAVDGGTFVVAAMVLATLPPLQPGQPATGSANAVRPNAESDARTLHQPAPMPTRQAQDDDPLERELEAMGPGLRPALGFAVRHREILHAALGKVPVAMANGGAWVLMHHTAAVGGTAVGGTALALGVLHAARAVGTGIGPVLWAKNARLRGSALGLHASTGFAIAAVIAFTLSSTPWLSIVLCVLWGLGSGANWVTAVTRTQVLTPNRVLGRVASIDLMSHALGQGIGGLLGALAADALQEPHLSGWIGAATGLCCWLILARVCRQGRR